MDTSTGKDSWVDISESIAYGLGLIRQEYFKLCLGHLQRFSSEAIKNDVLGGDAELAIKGYQLGLVSTVIGTYQYISPSDAKEFSDLLYYKVCGDDIDRCVSFLERYYATDSGDPVTKLLADMIRYVHDSEDADIALVAGLLPLEFKLSAGTQVVVSRCFGDKARAEKILSNLASPAALGRKQKTSSSGCISSLIIMITPMIILTVIVFWVLR